MTHTLKLAELHVKNAELKAKGNDTKGSAAEYQKAFDIYKRLAVEDPGMWEKAIEVAEAVAAMYSQAGMLSESQEALDAAITIRERLAQREAVRVEDE